MEQFHVTPVDPPKKKQSKKSIVFIIIAAVVFIGAVGAAGYFAYQNSAKQSRVTQLEAEKTKLNSQLTQLKSDVNKAASGEQTSDEGSKNVGALSAALNDLQKQRVDITSSDEETILLVAQKHFKADSLPEGAAVIVAFEMDKPGTTPTGDVYAAVYWPKSGTEPAQFIGVKKQAGSETWRYDASY